jgi:hypothetical protein
LQGTGKFMRHVKLRPGTPLPPGGRQSGSSLPGCAGSARAVDTCHPLMVRYDTLSEEWESPHDRSRLSQDCPEPGRRGRVPHAGLPAFRIRSRKFASLASQAEGELQKLGDFYTKTSSWVNTASDIRILGGVLFCHRRYDTVFVHHNGAESYYTARAFRGSLRV